MSELLPTRRLVILSALASASLPAAQLPGARAHANQQGGICLYDAREPASRAFAQAFGRQAVDAGPDVIRTLRDTLKAANPHHVAGLVGWAHFLLAREALAEHGYRIGQIFEHRVSPNGVAHSVQVGRQRKDVILPAADWAGALGRMLRAHESPRPTRGMDAPRSLQTGALLFSWTATFRKARQHRFPYATTT